MCVKDRGVIRQEQKKRKELLFFYLKCFKATTATTATRVKILPVKVSTLKVMFSWLCMGAACNVLNSLPVFSRLQLANLDLDYCHGGIKMQVFTTRFNVMETEHCLKVTLHGNSAWKKHCVDLTEI